MLSQLPDWLYRKAKRSSRQPTRTRKLGAESLEQRQLLTTVTMTDYEQLLLELVNRARANPLAEVARNSGVSDLNQGVTGTQITSTPKQPLASVQLLVDAGRLHAADMLENNYFSHYTGGTPIPAPPAEPENDPTDRAAALGYSGPVGENIAWNGSTLAIDNVAETQNAHDNLFLSPSHRVNMMVDNYDHAGMAAEFGQFSTSSNTFNAIMVVQGYGFNSGNAYITGVAYDDSVTADDFYTVGESLGGVRITALHTGTGESYWTTTGPSGGYQLQVPAGIYTVTASGGPLQETMVTSGVVITTSNVKVDFDSSESVIAYQDIVGITGNQFWVSESTGTRFGTRYYGSLPSSLTYDHIGTGDFNGDGLDDYLSRGSNGNLYVSVSTGDSFFTSQWGNFATVTTWETILIGDFDGNGLDDVMGRADNDGSFWLARSDGNRFMNSRWGRLSTGVQWEDLLVGDFTGDNNDDIAGRAQDGTWWVARSNGSDRLLNSYWGRWSSTVQWSDVTVGDYNNDGLDDIMGRVNNTHFWVNRSSGNHSFFIEYWGLWANVAWTDVTVGDFDGDGDDDVAARVGGQWWLALSDGSRFTNRYWGSWSTTFVYQHVQAVDMNGDGRDDLIGRAPNGHWWLGTSTGTGFVNSIATSWSTAVNWAGVSIGSFNA